MQTPGPLIAFGRRAEAFSLVEVVIAVAIISFALITLLGLLGASLSTSQHARDSTMVASLAQRVLSETMTNQSTALTTLSTTEYFTGDGLPTANTPASPALYKCTIVGQSVSSLPGHYVLPLNAVSTSGLSFVLIKFSWPATAAQPNVESFQTVLAGN